MWAKVSVAALAMVDCATTVKIMSRRLGAQAATNRRPANARASSRKSKPSWAAWPAPGARRLIASPRATGAATPAALPANTRARDAATRQRRPGAPERMTRAARSRIERQKSNFTDAGAMASGTA